MDEVNADDLNELESRLYAQVHHEQVSECFATAPTTFAEAGEHQEQDQLAPVSTSNKVPHTRYWLKGNAAKNPLAPRPIVPVDTTSAYNERVAVAAISSLHQQLSASSARQLQKPRPFITNGRPNSVPIAKKPKQILGIPSIPPPWNPNLRINPIATARAQKRQRQKGQKRLKESSVNASVLPTTNCPPFAAKAQKLQKAIRLEGKRQKSKQVHREVVKRNQLRGIQTETIELHSSGESDGDDVILVPLPPVVPIRVDDSDDEQEIKKKCKVLVKQENSGELEALKYDENAVDATEVSLENDFIKPSSALHDKRVVDRAESSVSPTSSVQSSDDFIVQNDRSRLLKNSGAADDHDLLMLTTNVNNSGKKKAPEPQQEQEQAKEKSNEQQPSVQDESSNDFQEPNLHKTKTTTKPLRIATAASAAVRGKHAYRVDQSQSQFRAVDVYESESDITDSVYAKGTPKPTIIRTLHGSSEAEDEEPPAANIQKLKRLRKRRASGSQKGTGSDANGAEDGADSDDEDENGVGETGVSFISRGPALERCKERLRRVPRRTSSGGGYARENMCDSKFIATLNSLAQGEGNGQEDGAEEDDEDSSEVENAPTARDIAEKVLEQAQSSNSKQKRSALTSAALPEAALGTLNQVFNTIDELERNKRPQSEDIDNTMEVQSASDSDGEVEVVFELPGSAFHNIVPTLKSKNRTIPDPIHHIIYGTNGNEQQLGGLGWNDEMRRFYNDSWKGENFNLKDLWRKMNPNKKLWKIYTEDRFPKERRFSNLKCMNCCEFGHIRAKCKRPKKPAICYMCGERGHFEPRCPNTICLKCGNKTHIYTKSCNACTFQNRLICPLCKVRGHTLNYCPDKWRRYHSTTIPNVYPNAQIEYKRRKFCCVCGRPGHLAETCRSSVRFQEYPTIVSEVKSHQKSYSDLSFKNAQSGVAFNLLYQPSMDYSFDLAENTSRESYYNRFLKAVGMGYLLRRKRRSAAIAAPSSSAIPTKQMKTKKSATAEIGALPQYVPNPYMRKSRELAALSESQSQRQEAPDQVQEISESGNPDTCDTTAENSSSEEEFVVIESIECNEAAAAEDTEEVEENVAVEAESQPMQESVEEHVQRGDDEAVDSFKTPTELASTTARTVLNESLPLDSDSNYSFSEHFEEPPQQSSVREVEPMPDFIPLNSADVEDDEEQAQEDDELEPTGISRRFVTAETDDEADNGSSDLPCEAKIYLMHFHSKYLLSPEGQKFLLEKSQANNIKARIDFTSVGHVLVIFGQPAHQDRFHRELLAKYRELKEKMTNRRMDASCQVPKRTDVLVRFLRDSLNQLLTNLGNANDHLKRLKQLEHQNSKSSCKTAERTRRLLNMILLGQAGLCDGGRHLDKLLISLKSLLNERKGEELASANLREEIDANWKVIFTSYRHDNYPLLVQSYNKLASKNRLPQLNIDPLLLGNRQLNLTPNAGTASKRPTNMVMNPLNAKNIKLHNDKQKAIPQKSQTLSSPPPIPPPPPHISTLTPQAAPTTAQSKAANISNTPSKATNPAATSAKNTTSSAKKKSSQPPCANPQQKSKCPNLPGSQLQSTCNNLLSSRDKVGAKTDKASKSNEGARVSKGPSLFWSRESIQYLDECIKLASSAELLAKLQRILQKSHSGALSYNDYRAVIKLHGTMLGK